MKQNKNPPFHRWRVFELKRPSLRAVFAEMANGMDLLFAAGAAQKISVGGVVLGDIDHGGAAFFFIPGYLFEFVLVLSACLFQIFQSSSPHT